MKEVKTQSVKIRCTDSELKKIKEMAEKCHRTVSSYIMSLIYAEMERGK